MTVMPVRPAATGVLDISSPHITMSNTQPTSITVPSGVFAEIARTHLGIPQLDARDNNEPDFYDCAVWSIKEALNAAYARGQAAANGQDQARDFANDLRVDLLEQFAQTATCTATRLVAHTAWISSEPIATLQQLANATTSSHQLSPQLAAAAQELLRRLRLDDRG